MTQKMLIYLVAPLALAAAQALAAERTFEPEIQSMEPMPLRHPIQESAVTQTQVALPNLVVDDLRLDEGCRVLVMLHNDGPGALGSEAWMDRGTGSVSVTLKLGGVNWGSEPIWRIDPVRALQPAGGKTTYFSKLIVTGSQSVTATVDAENLLQERNKSDNEKTEQLSCSAP